jgi:hypothetical protein
MSFTKPSELGLTLRHVSTPEECYAYAGYVNELVARKFISVPVGKQLVQKFYIKANQLKSCTT